MFNNSSLSQNYMQSAYACADSGCLATIQETPGISELDLFTHQTGHLLVTLGAMMVNVSSFSQHIDRNTGELLISLGNKLKARK